MHNEAKQKDKDDKENMEFEGRTKSDNKTFKNRNTADPEGYDGEAEADIENDELAVDSSADELVGQLQQ